MKELTVKIESINDVKEFVDLAVTCPCEIDLVSGRYIVDAKSIMGIFSLDLTKTLKLEAHGEGSEAALEKFKKFAV